MHNLNISNTISIKLCLLCVLAALMLNAQKRNDKPFLTVRRNGEEKKIECTAITANAIGDITIVTKDGVKAVYKKGGYIIAHIPKPIEVQTLEDLLEDESYNKLTQTAPQVFTTYKWLGWADTIARCHCEGLLALGKTDDAEQFITEAMKYPRADNFNVNSVRLQILVHNNKLAEVEAALKDMMKADNDAVSAFVFNMRGRIFEIAGRKKEAVHQYLKTVLLFEDKKDVRRFRRQAKASAIRLMKDLGDPAAATIEKMK